MARLQRVDLNNVLAQMPPIVDFGQSVAASQDIDLLISISGFEPRGDAIAKALVDAGRRVQRACYITYGSDPEDDTASRDDLMAALLRLTSNVSSLEANAAEEAFTDGLRALVEAVRLDDGSLPLVVLDISVASSRVLTRCVHALLHARVRLVVAYTQAELYYPTKDEFHAWLKERKKAKEERNLTLEQIHSLASAPDVTLGLDHGADKVEFLADFKVQHLESLPDRVIAFPAYNAARARMFLDHIDSALNENHPNDAVTWLVGNPLLEEDKWRFHALAAVNTLVNDDWSTHEQAQEVTTFDYIEVLRTLGTIYEDTFGREKVTICSMGSKMQNLAAVLFCELHPDVRLGQALPESYNREKYSEGVAALWAIDFNTTPDVLDNFSRYGTATIVED